MCVMVSHELKCALLWLESVGVGTGIGRDVM